MVLPARVEVRQADALPTLSLLAREGDPAAAIALSVATEAGVAETTALAALVERRLRQAGFAWTTVRADADGYRLEVLVNGPEQAEALVIELHHALLSPLVPTAEDLAYVVDRLRQRPSIPAGFEAIAFCQGQLDDASDFDPSSRESLRPIEALRQKAHVAQRLSLAVVGPYAVVDAASRRSASLAWPQGKAPKASSIDVRPHTAVLPGSHARVTVAIRVGDAAAARWAAQRLGEPGSALASRLSALPLPFRLDAASANARLHGGCLTATIEAETLADEASTAEATAILLRELRLHLDEAADAPVARDVYRTALSAEDPREAAALASWWSLASPSAVRNPPAAIVARLPSLDTTRGDASARFAAAVQGFEHGLDKPRLVPRLRLEPGQGRFALLLASPCGTSLESVKDAGLTALTVLAASAQANPRADVVLEPWLSPDGVGWLAQAQRLPGESASDLATRVANEAGRAIAGLLRAPSGFHDARSVLLHQLAKQGSAFDLAVEALLPSHPSWLVPHGRFDSVARQGPEAVALRARALLQGPLTLAVLADESEEQAFVAARVLERHLPLTTSAPPSCPAPGPRAPATFGLFHVDLDADAPLARATLAFPAPGRRDADREHAKLLVAALDGPDGLVARALAGFPDAAATVRLQGGSLASAVLLEVEAPSATLDPAIATLRGLLQRLASGAMTTEEYERARAELAEKAFVASLDPRKRIVDLVLGTEPERAPTLEGARSLAARIFRENNAVLVLARPKQR